MESRVSAIPNWSIPWISFTSSRTMRRESRPSSSFTRTLTRSPSSTYPTPTLTVTLPNRNYEYFLEAENEETLLSKEEGGGRNHRFARCEKLTRIREMRKERLNIRTPLKQLLVDLIKSDGSLTQSEMAKRLNVSARTIRRLINETKELSVSDPSRRDIGK